MKVEWSDDALADLDRFAAFLQQHYPALARIVAREIIEKAQVLSDHPRLGRPICRPQRIPPARTESVERTVRVPVSR